MLHFDLNISITLKELPFVERFDAAAGLGFGAVEFWWPAGEDLGMLIRRAQDAGLAVVLINFDAGAMAQGERGMLNHPLRQAEFRANVPVALELARKLGCNRLNALAGKWLADEPREAQLARVRENLHWAAELAAEAGITILVESLNSWENSGYLFCDTASTLAFLESVGRSNLQYQYDIYHMQRMEGNITATIQAYSRQIGHIQVADAPGRHQPGSGELCYPFIFQAIEQSDYRGYIGLEYNPQGSLAESLAWLPADRRGAIPLAALRL